MLFSLASLAGGLADSRTVLIIARLVQGLGGAVVAPASLSILTSTFTEPKERHRAVGIWGAMGGAGGAAGVLLGGVITDALSWRWIFFINLPIGLVTAFLSQRMLLEGRNENATRNFDLLGALTATVGLSALVYGIVRTDSSGWGDPTTLIAIGAGVALLAIFLVLEGRFAKAPLMPLRLFRSRQLSAANVDHRRWSAPRRSRCGSSSPCTCRTCCGYSPLKAGLVFLPMTLAIVVGSTIASRITMRVGAKRLLILGHGAARGRARRCSPTSASHSDYLGELLIPGPARVVRRCRWRSSRSTIAATSGVKPRGGGARLGGRQHRTAVRRRARARDPGDARDLALQHLICSHPTRSDPHGERGAGQRLPAGVLGRGGHRRVRRPRGRVRRCRAAAAATSARAARAQAAEASGREPGR